MTEEASRRLRHSRTPSGPLAIGATESTAGVRLPPLLTRFHRRYPGVEMSLITDSSMELTEKVRNGTLDCALVAGPVNRPDLECIPLLEEELVLVHLHSQLNPSGLRTFLVFGSGCTYRARLESWLRHTGTLPFRLMEFGTFEAILGCARAGMGTGVLTRSATEHWLRDGDLHLHPLPDPFARVPTVLLRRRDPYPSPALEAFAEMAEAFLSGKTSAV
nr:LysR substrate-binding domain-containing protein [Melghirimyces profundicolus]